MRIAWFSPITNPLLSRASTLTKWWAEVCPDDWEVEFFVDNLDTVINLNHKKTFHYFRVNERAKIKPFDIYVYQVEDNSDCSFVVRSLHLWPGMVFFHDLNLNQLQMSRFAHSTAGSDVNEYMDKSFGAESPRLGDWKVRGWPTDVFDRDFPLGEEEINSAASVVVPNIHMKKHVERVSGKVARLFPGVTNREKIVPRGLNDSKLVVGLSANPTVFGHHDTVNEVIGELEEARLVCIRKEPLEEVKQMLVGIDVFIDLTYSPLRSCSQLVLECLRHGIPVIVSDSPATEMLNGNIIKIPPGVGERESLKIALQHLIKRAPFPREPKKPKDLVEEFKEVIEGAVTDCQKKFKSFQEKKNKARENHLQYILQSLPDEMVSGIKNLNW